MILCTTHKALMETVHLALPLSDSRMVKARTKQAKLKITPELNSRTTDVTDFKGSFLSLLKKIWTQLCEGVID